MRTAIYYPNIQLNNPEFVKSALLLWDQVEVIVPFQDGQWTYDDADMQDAADLIVRQYCPTDDVKQLAHDAVLDLVSQDLPDWFFFEYQDREFYHNIYPQKFLDETWDELTARKLVHVTLEGRSRTMTEALALRMMTILADCCAGSQKRPVTDVVDAYACHDAYLNVIGGGEQVDDPGDLEDMERLVSISLKVFDPTSIDMRQLINLRQREADEASGRLRGLRHGYLEKIESCAQKIAAKARHAGDVMEIEREFEQTMKDDLGALREELKLKALDVLLSKEMIVGVVAAVGSFFQPVLGLPTAGVALARIKVKYTAERNQSLENHVMSWLYSTKKFQAY